MIKKFKEYFKEGYYDIRKTIYPEEIEDQFLRLKELYDCKFYNISGNIEITDPRHLYQWESISKSNLGRWMVHFKIKPPYENIFRSNTLSVIDDIPKLKEKIESELIDIKNRIEGIYPSLSVSYGNFDNNWWNGFMYDVKINTYDQLSKKSEK
jgi:hypothetical protein